MQKWQPKSVRAKVASSRTTVARATNERRLFSCPQLRSRFAVAHSAFLIQLLSHSSKVAFFALLFRFSSVRFNLQQSVLRNKAACFWRTPKACGCSLQPKNISSTYNQSSSLSRADLGAFGVCARAFRDFLPQLATRQNS